MPRVCDDVLVCFTLCPNSAYFLVWLDTQAHEDTQGYFIHETRRTNTLSQKQTDGQKNTQEIRNLDTQVGSGAGSGMTDTQDTLLLNKRKPKVLQVYCC